MPTKFVLAPTQASYSVRDGEATLSVRLDGGASRYRRDVLNANRIVTCEWRLSAGDFQYFRAFYNTETVSGSGGFLIDLIIDDADLTEHEAHFVPNTVQMSVVSGTTYSVRADLEVQPIARDAVYDASLVDVYEAYGGTEAAQAVLNQLEQLVNVDFEELLV